MLVVRFGFIFLLLCSNAFADLTFWSPYGYGLTYVLPEGVTPLQYLKNVERYPGLSAFVAGLKFSPQDHVISVNPEKRQAMERAILVANKAEDHELVHNRVDSFGRNFDRTFVYPVGAALKLDKKNEQKFYSELGEHFGLFVFMGGDDKHPGLSGEKTTWSVETNRLRDQLEEKLIRYVYYRTKAKIFGVCRGLQQVFTALGGKLHQDIVKELGVTEEEHKDKVKHPLLFKETLNNLIHNIFKILPEAGALSHHHQAARKTSVVGTVFEVAAMSPKGVIEALESRDGRIILVQFHPEMLENMADYTKNFFASLKKWVQESSLVYLCRKLF